MAKSQPVMQSTAPSAAVKLNVSNAVTSGINALGNVTGALGAIDLSKGNVVTMTLTGNVTSSSFSNAVASAGEEVTFIITQNGTGGWTFAWPAAVVPAGISPCPSIAAGAVSVFKGVVDGSGNINFAANGPVTVSIVRTAGLVASGSANTFTPAAIGKYRVTTLLSVATIGAGGSTMTVQAKTCNGNGGGFVSTAVANTSITVSTGSVDAEFASVASQASQAMGYSVVLTGTIGTAVYQVDTIVEYLGN